MSKREETHLNLQWNEDGLLQCYVNERHVSGIHICYRN